jgi:hypothetical protein
MSRIAGNEALRNVLRIAEVKRLDVDHQHIEVQLETAGIVPAFNVNK